MSKKQNKRNENRGQSLYQNWLKLFFKRHKTAVAASLERLKKHKLATLLTCSVIAMTLVLPLVLFILVKNIEGVTQGLGNSTKISIYLQLGTSAQEVQELVDELSNQDSIANIQYISPEQGLHEFADSIGFNHLLDGLDSNPLPVVLVITPSIAYQSPDKIAELASQLQTLPHIDQVQMDMAWVKRIFALLKLVQQIALGIGIILGLGIVIIVGNTIRYALENYRQEIDVLKLIGASDVMIRRPFLYTGIFYGLLGTLLAVIIVAIFAASMLGVVNGVAQSFAAEFHMSLFSLSDILMICFLGGALGLAGAWVVVSRHIATSSL